MPEASKWFRGEISEKGTHMREFKPMPLDSCEFFYSDDKKTNTLKQQQQQQQGWLTKFLCDSCKFFCLEPKQTQQDLRKQQQQLINNNNNSHQMNDQDTIKKQTSHINSNPRSRQHSCELPEITSTPLSTSEDNRLEAKTLFQLDGGGEEVEEEKQEIMLDRAFDVIIFGASSSVGKFLVEELALVVDKYYSSPNQREIITSTTNIKELRDPIQFAQLSNSINRRLSVPRTINDGIKWGIAGRSAAKLSDTLNRAELSTGIKGLSNRVPVLLADLNHHKSLLDMCQKTLLVINCVGPYTTCGEVVIKACLESKTNYIDLAHEPAFIEMMRQKYSAQALVSEIYIINGCGFHSMSAEMGLSFSKQVVDGQVDEVKIIFNLSDTKALIKSTGGASGSSGGATKASGLITSGMWNSLLIDRASETPTGLMGASNDGITGTNSNTQSKQSNGKQYNQLRRKDTQTLVRDMIKFKSNNNAHAWLQLLRMFTKGGRKYCLPTSSLTLSEESQLISGEMGTYAGRSPDVDSSGGWRPISCTSFITMRSFIEALTVLVWLLIFNTLVRFSPLRTIMQAFPTIFSLGNVTSNKNDISQLDRNSLSHVKFCQTFIAYGTPGDESGDPLEARDKNIRRKQEQLLVARVVGPEPNRVATATYAIQAALTMILERDHLPLKGGVMTPGAAFSETNIIHHLRKRNIKFEVLKKA